MNGVKVCMRCGDALLSVDGYREDLVESQGASQGASRGSVVKNHLPMQEMWVRSLSREDPLGTEMGTYSSPLENPGFSRKTLPGESMDREKPGGLQPMGWQESDMT